MITLTDHEKEALNKISRFINFRMRSIQETTDKLHALGYQDETVSQLLEYLSELDLLNDERFARVWAENRLESKKSSRSKIRMELKQKGISDAIILPVLDSIFQNVSEIETALLLLQKKFRNPTPDFNPKKAMDFLARNGYSYSTTKEAVHHYLKSNPDDE